MALDDGDFDDPGDEEFSDHRPWLPPEDRLWRHPSELSGGGLSWSGGRRPPHHWSLREHRWPLLVSAGFLGAMLATGVTAAVAHLGSSKSPSTPSYALTTADNGSSNPSSTVASGLMGAAPSVSRMAERVLPAMVTLEVGARTGTRRGGGLVIQSDGTILTTDRLVQDSSSITAVTSRGAEEAATVVGEDPSSDLAVLHVAATDLPTVTFGQSSSLAPSQVTLAVTVPATKSTQPADVYLGTIDSVDAQVQMAGWSPPLLDVIETDTPVTGQSDGGALLDSQGRVVGITAGTVQTGSTVHCLATASDLDQEAAYQLLSWGRSYHAWLGIQGGNATSDSASGSQPTGVEVESVDPGSPAANAGIVPGEVITSIDSRPVTSLLALQGDVHLLSPGSVVQLAVRRGGSSSVVQATLGAVAS